MIAQIIWGIVLTPVTLLGQLILYLIYFRKRKAENGIIIYPPKDWQHRLARAGFILGAFTGITIFILTGSGNIWQLWSGLIACVGDGLKILNNVHPVAVILIVMWVCGAAAAVTNNVSFTAAVVSIIGLFMQNSPAFSGNPVLCEIMWWALALSVCLGGNGSLVGAAANLVAVGMAEKAGFKLTFGDFMRYGLPVTLGSMIIASAYIVVRYAWQVGF